MRPPLRVVTPNERGWRGLDVLRILMGVIWSANLVFILLPSAEYWSTFAAVADSFGPSTLGGPGLPDYVAAHPLVFSWLIAIATAYLALAFLLGATTRLACGVGAIASVGFLLTQWNTTFSFPGGTDVGPHPLYLAVYTAMFVGGAGRFWSLDSWVWKSGRARWARVAAYVATPAPPPPPKPGAPQP